MLNLRRYNCGKVTYLLKKIFIQNLFEGSLQLNKNASTHIYLVKNLYF